MMPNAGYIDHTTNNVTKEHKLSCQVDKELKEQISFMSQPWSNAVLGISA